MDNSGQGNQEGIGPHFSQPLSRGSLPGFALAVTTVRAGGPPAEQLEKPPPRRLTASERQVLALRQTNHVAFDAFMFVCAPCHTPDYSASRAISQAPRCRPFAVSLPVAGVYFMR
jgi:hypothetical protein